MSPASRSFAIAVTTALVIASAVPALASAAHDDGPSEPEEVAPSSLGDRVWADDDLDGIQDDGEPGVADFTVTLWTDDDTDGTPDTQIAVTTTDTDGSYLFDQLDPALDYVVQFGPPEWFFTDRDVGSDDAVDSDADPSTGTTGVIELDAGEHDPTIDAGTIEPTVHVDASSLGDRVWRDLDEDGIQDAGEPGVADVRVDLWSDDDADGEPDSWLRTTTTDDDGYYGFAHLASFNGYFVQFLTRSPLTVKDAGDDDAVDSDADPTTGFTDVIVPDFGVYTRIDAGIVEGVAAASAALGDRVWLDTDQDGIQDAGEPGVADVEVNLWTDDDADGGPDTLLATTTTDADGSYRFDTLAPGVDYVVQFVQPSEYVLTGEDAGHDAVDSDPDMTTGITGVIELAADEYDDTIDAGLYVPPVTGAGTGTPLAVAVAMLGFGGALVTATRRRPRGAQARPTSGT